MAKVAIVPSLVNRGQVSFDVLRTVLRKCTRPWCPPRPVPPARLLRPTPARDVEAFPPSARPRGTVFLCAPTARSRRINILVVPDHIKLRKTYVFRNKNTTSIRMHQKPQFCTFELSHPHALHKPPRSGASILCLILLVHDTWAVQLDIPRMILCVCV